MSTSTNVRDVLWKELVPYDDNKHWLYQHHVIADGTDDYRVPYYKMLRNGPDKYGNMQYTMWREKRVVPGASYRVDKKDAVGVDSISYYTFDGELIMTTSERYFTIDPTAPRPRPVSYCHSWLAEGLKCRKGYIVSYKDKNGNSLDWEKKNGPNTPVTSERYDLSEAVELPPPDFSKIDMTAGLVDNLTKEMTCVIC